MTKSGPYKGRRTSEWHVERLKLICTKCIPSNRYFIVMTNSRGLVAKKVQDVNGRLVTRWFRPDGSEPSPSEALAAASAAGGTSVPSSVPVDLDWEKLSPERTKTMVAAVKANIDDPDKIWSNFDLLTNAYSSKNGLNALGASMEGGDPTVSLRDAWLKKHHVEFANWDAYRTIGGDDGYESYRAAWKSLTNAASDTLYGADWNTLSSEEAGIALGQVGRMLESPQKLWDNFDLYTKALNSNHAPAALRALDAEDNDKGSIPTRLRDTWLRMHNENALTTSYQKVEGPDGYQRYREAYAAFSDAGVAARKRIEQEQALSLGDRVDDFRDHVEERVETVSDAAGSAYDNFRDRQEAEPSPGEGSFTSWSALNPFKRRKN